MRLDIVSALYGLEPGGAEISTRLLVQELKSLKVDVEVISSRKEALEQPAGAVLPGIHIIPTPVILNGSNRITDWWFRREFIKRWLVRKPDVVLIEDHMSIVGAVEAVEALRGRGQKIILALTQMWEVDPEFFLRYRPLYMSVPTVYRFNVANRLARRMDFINAATPYIRSRLVARFGVNYNKCHVIHTVGLPQTDVPNTDGYTEPLIIAPGRMNPEKGSFFFLDVVERIALHRRDFRAMFLGGGPYEKLIRKQINRRKLSDVCFVTGKIPYREFLSLYRSARVIALPIMYPCAYTRVALESLGAGKPIVTFDQGSMPDIVINGETGYRTPPHSVEPFASACERFLDDPSLSIKMAVNCQNTAKKFGDISDATRSLVKQLNALVLKGSE